MASQSDKWKGFERLVTAIHKVADEGADVRWNEQINGRQFDITIRFRRGLYEYLTVIECKDYGKPVPVEKIEAFVTKSGDAHANHAVMASTSGFQEGAKVVAERHNMTLIHVTESTEIDLSPFRGQWIGTSVAFHIQTVKLQYADGDEKQLSDQSNELTYYVTNILLRHRNEVRTLNDVIREQLNVSQLDGIDVYRDHIIRCQPNTYVIGPQDGQIPLKIIVSAYLRAGFTTARVFTSPAQIDPYLLLPQVKVHNIATGEQQIFSQHGLPLGFNTQFAEGHYYELPQIAAFYYCDRVEGDVATIFLIESFQLGKLFQAEFTMKTEFAKLYLPVTDKDVLARLDRRLTEVKKLKRQRS